MNKNNNLSRRNRKRKDSSEEELDNRPGPFATGFRPHSVPIHNDGRNNLRQEISLELNEMKNNLRSDIINDIRETLREDLERHRRTAREEIHNLLRTTTRPEISSDVPVPSPILDNNPNSITTNATIHASHNPPNIALSNTIEALMSSNKHFHIQPDTYDGSQPWSHYKKHFEIASETNGWSNEMKASQLLTRLRSKAQLILEKIPETDLKNYKKITEALTNRFDDRHLSRMYFNDLQARKQKKDESYTTYSEEIERLVRLAYPDMSEDNRDRIACLSFITGIDSPKSEFTVRSERLESLREAVERATELKSISSLLNSRKQNSQTLNNRPQHNEFSSQNHQYKQNKIIKPDILCFKCKKHGHYANKCDESYINNSQNNQLTPHTNSSQNASQNPNSYHPYRNFDNGNRFSKNTNKNDNHNRNQQTFSRNPEN